MFLTNATTVYPLYKKGLKWVREASSTVKSSSMERAFSGEFQSDCLNFPSHFLLDVVSSFDDVSSSSCYLFFYLDTHPEGRLCSAWDSLLGTPAGCPKSFLSGFLLDVFSKRPGVLLSVCLSIYRHLFLLFYIHWVNSSIYNWKYGKHRSCSKTYRTMH